MLSAPFLQRDPVPAAPHARSSLCCSAAEFIPNDRALIVDAQASTEYRDRGAGLTIEAQRTAEVIKRVGVGEACFGGRLCAVGERLAARGQRRAQVTDRRRVAPLTEKLMAAGLELCGRSGA
jgi:hypothetical protein